MSVAFTLSTPTPWWRPLGRADRYALLVLLALPALLFGVPAAFGHPAVAADNLIQNYPLRVLTGRQLASAHLPLINPLADSGTPLLGGMNAGSFFPLTFLFALVPGILAWVINLVAVYAAAGIGVYALARYHGLRPSAALTGSLVYAYVGAMTGQLVHLGVVQGFALLPWAVLVMLVLAERVRTHARWVRLVPPVMGLSALWALTWLSGEPRAIGEMELVGMLVGAVVLLAPGRWRPSSWAQRARYVLAVLIGLGWGVLIGFAQIITGWSYIAVSQRTNLSYAFFGSGSLAVRWSALWFVPDLFGGNGILHQPHYFATYNLPEVTGYAGVVALMAACAYAAQLVGRVRRWAVREFSLYGVMGFVGVWATWGNYTPVGHVFALIPLFHSTRLQSRNVILVDLAASVLLAWWLDRLIERDRDGASLVGWRRLVTGAPALVTALLSVSALLAGPALVRWLGVSARASRWASYERPTLVVHLAIALVGLWLLYVRRNQVRALLSVIAADAILFFAFCSTGLSPGNVPVSPSRTYAVAHLGLTGRFALVDPTGAAGDQFIRLGLPNTNVFTQLPSIQGYGSLIDAYYGTETGTHPLFSLNACNLVRGQFRTLRLASLVVASGQLLNPASVGPRFCETPRWTYTLYRYFGRLEALSAVSVSGYDGAALSASALSLQLLGAHGQPVGPPRTAPSGTSVTFHTAGQEAAGFTLSSTSALRAGSTILRTTHGRAYQASTTFQQAVATSYWHLSETNANLAYFHATSQLPSAWVASLSTGRVLSVRNAVWGDTWVRVNARRATTLLHSMEWIPGWRATASELGTSRVIALTVHRNGLIQSVNLPPGAWIVHFHYHAPHIELGLLGTGVGGVGFLGALGLLWRSRRPRVEA